MPEPPEKVEMVVYRTQDTDRTPDVKTTSVQAGPHARFEDDERERVDEARICEGGDCRACVKILVGTEHRCGKQTSPQGNTPADVLKWTLASGWVSAPDRIFTCAHCVIHQCEDCYAALPATYIKAYAGYHGKESVGTADANGVEFRYARSFAVQQKYVTLLRLGHSSRSMCDAAEVKLEEAFKSVKPLPYDATPIAFEGALGSFGYPKDKEHGQKMYGQWKQDVHFDLRTVKHNMLEHMISTSGGHSGAPILRRDSSNSLGVVIGIHRGCNGDKKVNLACPIAGHYGIPILSYNLALKEAEEQLKNQKSNFLVIKVRYSAMFDKEASNTGPKEITSAEEATLSRLRKAKAHLKEAKLQASGTEIDRIEKWIELVTRRVEMSIACVEVQGGQNNRSKTKRASTRKANYDVPSEGSELSFSRKSSSAEKYLPRSTNRIPPRHKSITRYP